jgi:hypothetical protein
MAEMARENPYPGPRSFEEQDSRNFFGRDEESRQLTSLVIAHRVVLLYAQSGAGKTSLLQASVIPDLKARKRVQVLPIARVSGDLPPGMSREEIGNVFVFNTLLSLAGHDAQPDAVRALTLCDGLAAHFRPQTSEGRLQPALLILDQFEEIFTLYPGRTEDRAGFFRQLQDCLADNPQLSLLFSMREDYIAEFDSYVAQLPDRLRTRYRIERLAYDGALAAVKGPAEGAGLPFAEGVAEALVDNLRRIQGPAPTAGEELSRGGESVSLRAAAPVLGPYVEPVHLQIVCRQLWDRLPPDRVEIRAEDVQEFGDVDQALIGFYESAVAKATEQTGVSERRLREWFGEKLITPSHTRGLVYQDKVRGETEGLPNAAVSILNNAYIIRASIRGSDTWFELAHDRMVEPILRANRDWEAQHRSPVSLATNAWLASGKDPGLLYRGAQVEQAAEQLGANPDEFSPEEQDFIKASQEMVRSLAERRQRRILLGAVGAVIVLLALTGWALVSSFAAVSQRQVAQIASTAAVASADTAVVDRAAAQSASTAAVGSASTAVADRAAAQVASTAAVASESTALAARNTAEADRAIAQAANTVAADSVATTVANYEWLLTQEANVVAMASPPETAAEGTPQAPFGTSTPNMVATVQAQLGVAQATQTALAQGQATPVPAVETRTPAPPAKPGVVLDFEQFGVWRRGDEPYGTFTQSSEQAHEGTFSGKLTYNIPAVQNHYVVFQRVPPAPIFGTPQTLTVWVYGDGSGNFLNAWIKDSQGEVRQFTFRRITHADGWQPMTLQLDTSAPWPQGHISGPDNSQLDYPISFQGFVLDAFPRSDISTYTGTVYLDELRTGEVPAPAATAAAVETAVVTSTIPATTRRATPAGATPVARQQAGATPAPTQPPRRPVAPLTGRIVYAQGSGGTSNLMVVNAADGATLWLAADARQPDVRADGRVIFDGIGGGKLNLWSIYLDGSKLREVSPHPEDSYPSWAPSGEGAVFYSTQHGDKKERVYIQQDTTRVEEPVTLKVNGKDAFGRTPTWLGNGRIAFSGCDYWAGGSQCGIWAVNSDGSGGPLQLTERADDRSTDSANGTLLYASQGSGNWEVFAVPETGGTPVNLTNSPSQDLGATFSPDGNHIAFISDRDGGWGIWIMNTDGSNAEKLIAVPDGFGPSWSEERLTWGP